jgi:NTE family protein
MQGDATVSGAAFGGPLAGNASAPRRIGVALGSGAARGLAHIGVMQALETQGLEVHCIAGTSMGAFVGSVYAAGNLRRLAQDFLAFDWKRIASLLDPVLPRSGLIDGQKVAEFLRAYTSRSRIEDLPVRFRAVAADMLTGAEAILDSGDVTEAVRASISVPGVLTPVRTNGRILLDGGLVNPVPVSVVRAMGAEQVIAVDVSHEVIASRLASLHESATARPVGTGAERLHEALLALNSPVAEQFWMWLHRESLPSILDVLLSAIYIMQARIAQTNLLRDKPDLIIRPPLGAIKFMDFDRAEEIIAIGYRATREALTAWHPG